MAVFNPNVPDTSNSYAQIQKALGTRAEMESNKAQPLDIATVGVKRADQYLTADREFAKKMSSEGKILVTDEGIKNFMDEINQDRPDKEKIKSNQLDRFKGLYMTPDEMKSHGTKILYDHELNVAIDNDPNMSPAEKAAAKSEKGQPDYFKKLFAPEKQKGSHVVVPDASKKSGYAYAIIDDNTGATINTGLEAPVPNSTGKGGGRGTPIDKRFKDLDESIDPSKQRQGAFGLSKQKFDRAENLQSLATAFPDGNLDSRQIEELAIGLNSLLSGSNTGAQMQVKALVPQTIWGNTQKLKEFLTNNPTGTQQQAFVQRLLGTIDREKQTSANQIERTQFSRIARNEDLRKEDPEKFNDILRSHAIDPEKYFAWKKAGFPSVSAVIPPPGENNGLPGITPKNKELPRFTSIEEADKAKLKPGTRVTVYDERNKRFREAVIE